MDSRKKVFVMMNLKATRNLRHKLADGDVTEKDHESYIDCGDHVSVPPMAAEESYECQNCDLTQNLVSGTMLPASGPMWEHSNSLFLN